jgi:3',5'-cyclic AMP phosphodiesterase CpdA
VGQVSRVVLAQLSDFHLLSPGQLWFGRVDTRAGLDRAVRGLLSLPQRPDAVICSGDLVNDGLPEQYELVREALRPIDVPLIPVVGNHDLRVEFRNAFADIGISFEPDPFVQYAVELNGLRVVVLDTLEERSVEPGFCAARLEWLKSTLAASAMPTVLVMHHPPFVPGVAGSDPADPHWATAIAGVLQSAPHVIRILSGHAHRTINSTWAGIQSSIAPSTAVQLRPNLDSTQSGSLTEEPGGFQLHRWEDGRLLSYTIVTDGVERTYSP